MYDIIIRKAAYGDIQEILELLYYLGRPKPQNNSDTHSFDNMIKQYVLDLDKDIIVAIINEVVIGMTSMMFLPRLNHFTPEMYISELVVSQKYQRQRVGENLISECVSIAREKNCHRMRLESGYDRVDAHSFYTHLGFVDNAKSFMLKLL